MSCGLAPSEKQDGNGYGQRAKGRCICVDQRVFLHQSLSFDNGDVKQRKGRKEWMGKGLRGGEGETGSGGGKGGRSAPVGGSLAGVPGGWLALSGGNFSAPAAREAIHGMRQAGDLVGAVLSAPVWGGIRLCPIALPCRRFPGAATFSPGAATFSFSCPAFQHMLYWNKHHPTISQPRIPYAIAAETEAFPCFRAKGALLKRS